VGHLRYPFTATANGTGQGLDPARANGTNWHIPEGGFVFIPVTVNESQLVAPETFDGRDLCIVDVDVTVTLRHPCTRQLEIVLFGPGPNSNDANHEPSAHSHTVQLFNHHDGTGGGCGRGLSSTRFDDDADEAIGGCCHSPFKGHFRPTEKLSAFNGLRSAGECLSTASLQCPNALHTCVSATRPPKTRRALVVCSPCARRSPPGEWVLGAYDRDADGLTGTVSSVQLHFTTKECDQTFHWTRLSQNIDDDDDGGGSAFVAPPPRAQHAAVVVGESLFVFGGKGFGPGGADWSVGSVASTAVLHDLWRFDRADATWHLLGSDSRGRGQSSWLSGRPNLGCLAASGRAALLSPWGLLTFGGLEDSDRVPPIGSDRGVGGYDARVWRLDLWSEEWGVVTADGVGHEDAGPVPGAAKTSAPRGGNGFAWGEPVPPHWHRSEGLLSGRGESHPLLAESGGPPMGRYLSAVTLVGAEQGEAPVVGATGHGSPHAAWPGVYHFGGDDGARVAHDDLRVFSLHGLAAEPPLGADGGKDGGASASVAELRQSRCVHRVKANTTAHRRWRSSCMADSATGDTHNGCNVHEVLQMAWCGAQYQAVGFL